MALHGDIRVNGQRIGYWSARRLECTHPGDVGVCPADHEYECYAEWYELGVVDGHDSGQRRHTFRLTHTYSHGAMSLAAKVTGCAATLGAAGVSTHG